MTTTQYQMHSGRDEFWNVRKWACDDSSCILFKF